MNELGIFKKNPDTWDYVALAAGGASAYHGYKRNASSNPLAWALWWGLWGAALPIITVPVALAQGFAEPSQS